MLKDFQLNSKNTLSAKVFLLVTLMGKCKPTNTQKGFLHTFILLPAVVGRPFLSALRFSGNSALMKGLWKNRNKELDLMTLSAQ